MMKLPTRALILTFLLEIIRQVAAIDCFQCLSINDSVKDCQDQFGPDNETEHVLQRNCKVGILRFKAFYCVKIKGVKANGDNIVIRTCSMDNWGTTCGNILFEQERDIKEPIDGCLASCDFDGCNHASKSLLGVFYTLSMASLALWKALVFTGL